MTPDSLRVPNRNTTLDLTLAGPPRERTYAFNSTAE